MQKLISFLLVLLMAGTALADNLPDIVEQTEKPTCACVYQEDGSYEVYMVASEYADIYYRVFFENDGTDDFFLYVYPIRFVEPGNYHIEAYAIEPGKTQSELVFMDFTVIENVDPHSNMTEPPYIEGTLLADGSYKITITPDEPNSEIFYHVNVSYDGGDVEPYDGFESFYDFKRYNDELYFSIPGDYGIQAYAQQPGLNQSDVATYGFTVSGSTEPTTAPTFYGEVIEVDGRYAGYRVSIYPTEPSQIYYRTFVRTDAEEWEWAELSEWAIYTEPIEFRTDGFYRVEAYAVADGKLMSSNCAFELYVEIPVENYDFEEDGIFYKIIGEGKVSVTSEMTGDYNHSYEGAVVIPDNVTHDGVTYQVCAIGDEAFSECPVTSVTIGDCVTRIGDAAFRNCYDLTEIVLGDYVIEVGNYAFSGCFHLSKLTIGSGVARIGTSAFANCQPTDIICKPATPPVMSGSTCFTCYASATLHVHPAVADSYRATDYWNRFADIVAEKKVAPAPGDMNNDGTIDVSDVTNLIGVVLNGN